MKTVDLKCPKCAAGNRYTVADLKAANGQAQCLHCGHRFTLIRKTKPSAPRTPPQTAANPEAELLQSKVPLREKLARLKQHSETLAAQQQNGKTAATEGETLTRQKTKASQAIPADASPPPTPEPVSARQTETTHKTTGSDPVPVADKKNDVPDIQTLLQRNAAIDNETGQPLPFRLHQEPANPPAARTDSAAAIEALLQRTSQAAPPAVLPNIDTLLKTIQQNTPAAAGSHTQNIHIQAQSLVFNLISGKDGAVRLPHAAGLPAVIDQPTDGGQPTDPPPPVSRQEHDFNWTLASLVALTVLIIQLFYYLLIMR